jgi:hypothetical protein
MSTLTTAQTTEHDDDMVDWDDGWTDRTPDDDLRDAWAEEDLPPPPKTQAELRTHAFHEAGHIVAHWLIRHPLILATIEPGEEDRWAGIAGRVSPAPVYITPWDQSFTLMAGPVAQAMLDLRDQKLEDLPPGHKLNFDDFVAGAFLSGGGSDLQGDGQTMDFASNNDLLEAVQLRLETHWPGVEAVASALILLGTLTGTEAYKLLDELHA